MHVTWSIMLAVPIVVLLVASSPGNGLSRDAPFSAVRRVSIGGVTVVRYFVANLVKRPNPW